MSKQRDYRPSPMAGQAEQAIGSASEQGSSSRFFVAGRAGAIMLPPSPSESFPGPFDQPQASQEECLFVECLPAEKGDPPDYLLRVMAESPRVILDAHAAGTEKGEDARREGGRTHQASRYAVLRRERLDVLLEQWTTLQQERQNLLMLFEMLDDSILVLGQDGVIHYVNPAACMLFARPKDNLVGFPFGFPIVESEAVDLDIVRPGGEERVAEMRATRVIWYGQSAWLASLRDVTERRRLEEELEQLATHDGLTGLYNNQTLFTLLEDELKRSRRNGRSISLLMIDIDHFKHVNDGYGHQIGDRVLAGFARLMTEQLRDVDRVCRYGGEEFSVIMPETALADAVDVAERLRRSVAAHRIDIGDGRWIPIRISLGVCCYPTHGRTACELVSAADGALYQAKKSGRDRVCVHEATPDVTAPEGTGATFATLAADL